MKPITTKNKGILKKKKKVLHLQHFHNKFQSTLKNEI